MPILLYRDPGQRHALPELHVRAQEEVEAPRTGVNAVRRSDAFPLIAAGLLSAAMLAFELTLTRLFAVAQFYHFAFMAISVALLGSGAAGSLLSVWPRLGRRPDLWSAGFALATLGSYAILNLLPFDSYAIAWDRIQVL